MTNYVCIMILRSDFIVERESIRTYNKFSLLFALISAEIFEINSIIDIFLMKSHYISFVIFLSVYFRICIIVITFKCKQWL